MTPLERVEALYLELVDHYGDGEEAQVRAAAKLLLVALDRFRRHGGATWPALVGDYVQTAERDPERFARMLDTQRGQVPGQWLA